MEIQGISEMSAHAARFITDLPPRKDTATIVTLSGDLGAGKTTLTQGIARALGVEETVTSPTFVLEKSYELTGQKWSRLIHIDAYRLVSEHELEVLGWREMAQDPANLIVIEWPEMVVELIPADAIRITLSGDGDVRELSIGRTL
ncbi:tRNA (adenosine(37)-N6)-threonylcarbamoyltransferase complex ATPase subunit type 1 TsaE [Candidatus Kaiserbacteria bacterium]|nr:tRNA (adenosine(37)-N6)-threonylcarbamoyltransferase complex ATPase subunit type 1 TsaE [Candidatus Kaiserbacteria bacterium]